MDSHGLGWRSAATIRYESSVAIQHGEVIVRRQRNQARATSLRAAGAICAVAVLVAAHVRADDKPQAAAEPAAAPAAAPAPAPPTAGGIPYWQAPPLPNAVIQGGAIPPGWQPQAVPYQGVGPDGRPMTMYFAPTYVFTYQAGPPVLAMPSPAYAPAVNRTVPPAAVPNGWNYATSGAQPATMSLAPGGVSRYQAAYRLPPDARALAGTPLVPPGSLPQQSAPPAMSWASTPTPQPVVQPSALPMAPPVPPPPTQWIASSPPQPPPAAPVAVAAGAAGAVVAAAPPPPVASVPPPSAPVLEPLPPQPPLKGSPPPPRAPAARTWRVVGVYDGDSLTCLDEGSQQQKVRLAGIDAPESGQPFAKESRDALAALVFGRTVEVVDEGRDPTGRVVARVSANGSDVARQLVASGNAWCAPSNTDPALVAAQSAAQAARLGIWSQATPTAPWDYRSGS
jgi:endonuclease YncB( thermonuclease family)